MEPLFKDLLLKKVYKSIFHSSQIMEVYIEKEDCIKKVECKSIKEILKFFD